MVIPPASEQMLYLLHKLRLAQYVDGVDTATLKRVFDHMLAGAVVVHRELNQRGVLATRANGEDVMAIVHEVMNARIEQKNKGYDE